MTSSFKSQEDLLTALPGEIYSFEGATLKAATAPPTANDKRVATTEWVNTVLGIEPGPPLVSASSGLNITYTSGTVANPYTGEHIQVEGTAQPIAVGGNSTEYVWVRYLDGAVIATSTTPSNNQGYLLATVSTTNSSVSSVTQNTNPVGWAPINSPSFSGDVTAPTPDLTDNSNRVPTTSWVRNAIQSTLVGSEFPTLSITGAGTGVVWSSGSVSLAGISYPVMSGQYAFTSSTNGTVFVHAVVVAGTTIVVVSPNTPTGAKVLLGSITVDSGEVVQVNMPSTVGFAPTTNPVFTGEPKAPTPPPNSKDGSIATTEWVVEAVTTKMAVGFGGHIKYIS